MGAVDKRAEIVGTAVGARRGEQRHAVVAPVALSGKIGERHQLDGGDPEVAQIRQLAGRGLKRAFGSKGPDMWRTISSATCF